MMDQLRVNTDHTFWQQLLKNRSPLTASFIQNILVQDIVISQQGCTISLTFYLSWRLLAAVADADKRFQGPSQAITTDIVVRKPKNLISPVLPCTV